MPPPPYTIKYTGQKTGTTRSFLTRNGSKRELADQIWAELSLSLSLSLSVYMYIILTSGLVQSREDLDDPVVFGQELVKMSVGQSYLGREHSLSPLYFGTSRNNSRNPCILEHPEIIVEKAPGAPVSAIPYCSTEKAVEKVPSPLSTQSFTFCYTKHAHDFLDMFRSQNLTKTMQRMARAFVYHSVSSITRNAIVSI